MKIVAAVILFWLVNIVLCRGAAAEISAKDFLSKLDAARGQDKTLLLIVIKETLNGFDWANTAVEYKYGSGLYCAPNKVVLTPEQGVDILRRYLQVHGGSEMLPLGMMLLDSVQDAMPCPK